MYIIGLYCILCIFDYSVLYYTVRVCISEWLQSPKPTLLSFTTPSLPRAIGSGRFLCLCLKNDVIDIRINECVCVLINTYHYMNRCVSYPLPMIYAIRDFPQHSQHCSIIYLQTCSRFLGQIVCVDFYMHWCTGCMLLTVIVEWQSASNCWPSNSCFILSRPYPVCIEYCPNQALVGIDHLRWYSMLLGPGYYHSFCFMGILWADNDNGDPMAHEDIVWTSPSSDIDFISIIAQNKNSSKHSFTYWYQQFLYASHSIIIDTFEIISQYYELSIIIDPTYFNTMDMLGSIATIMINPK